jgi:hypothetical protein
MRFIFSLTAALLLGYAVPAPAGQGPATPGAIATTTPGIDLARLPVDVARIGRQLRQAQIREERDGLKIRYSIDVYGELPKIQFITPLDNVLTGDVPRTAPTHNDMLRVMTPQEFSAPVMSFGSLPRRK